MKGIAPFTLCIAFALCLSKPGFSQGKSDTLHRRKAWVIAGTSLTYAALNVGLYQTWYKGYNTGRFHLFDDHAEWLQMDKIGHTVTAYYTGLFGYRLARWAGWSERASLWGGGSLGLAFLTTVEVMDGFSSGWGFSVSDMTANFLGTGLFIAQQKLWGEQRIGMRFSYTGSNLASIRPNLLGSNLAERLIKDYSGQTYWLSVSPFSFMGPRCASWRWMCVSIGYGGRGMIGAHENRWTDDQGNIQDYVQTIVRERAWYASLDVDLQQLPPHLKRKMGWIFNTIGFIKIPFPALEFRGGNVRFHPLYF
jgi:hypothetical protein